MPGSQQLDKSTSNIRNYQKLSSPSQFNFLGDLKDIIKTLSTFLSPELSINLSNIEKKNRKCREKDLGSLGENLCAMQSP